MNLAKRLDRIEDAQHAHRCADCWGIALEFDDEPEREPEPCSTCGKLCPSITLRLRFNDCRREDSGYDV